MVNIDNLVNEWAYRCKKGYPDMDSPSDLRLLKIILKEQGISLPEQQLSLFSDSELEAMVVKDTGKSIPDLTSKDITNLVQSGNYTKSQLITIKKLIEKVPTMELINDFLDKSAKESNILNKELLKFKSYLEELEILEAFAEYTKNPIDFNLSNGHFADDIKQIPKDKLISLYRKLGSTTDEKNVNIGPGEILFSILFKNVKKREEGGDLTVGSEANVELKASTGPSGAVIAKGYNRGDWKTTRKTGRFLKFIEELDMEDENEQDALKYLDIRKAWPIKLSLIYDLYTNDDKFNKEKFKDGVKNILSKIYNNSNWYPNGTFFDLDSYFTESDMDFVRFKNDLAKELIQEYMDHYKFDGILYIDKDGNIDYQKGDEITNSIGNKIQITGPSDDVPRFRLKK